MRYAPPAAHGSTCGAPGSNLRSAGLMHITRTQSDAARWIRANTGVNVSGNDLKNWRARGKMPGTRHIEGPYWAWNVLELLACAQAKDERDHDDA